MSGSNTTKHNNLVYSTGKRDETLEDIILQIWDMGAGGMFLDKEDVADLESQISKIVKSRKKGKS